MQPAAYHHTDPAYAPPLVNPPSPAASVTSIYGEDETTMSDAGLPEDKFEEKMQLAIGISQPSEWETHANRLVLLPKPKNPDDERGTSPRRAPDDERHSASAQSCTSTS